MDAPSTASLAPNDTMRNGIATVKSELSFVHPVQPMQANVSAHTQPPRSQLSLLRPRPPSPSRPPPPRRATILTARRAGAGVYRWRRAT